MKLREDLKKKEGAAFSREQLRDEFLKQGFPPLPIVRRALPGDSSPSYFHLMLQPMDGR